MSVYATSANIVRLEDFHMGATIPERGHKRPISGQPDQEAVMKRLRAGREDEAPATAGAANALQCSECGKSFKRLYTLKRHVGQVHGTEKPFQCGFDGCPESFARRDMLARHRATHDRTGYVTCNGCHGKFRPDYYLHEHLQARRNTACRAAYNAKIMAEMDGSKPQPIPSPKVVHPDGLPTPPYDSPMQASRTPSDRPPSSNGDDSQFALGTNSSVDAMSQIGEELSPATSPSYSEPVRGPDRSQDVSPSQIEAYVPTARDHADMSMHGQLFSDVQGKPWPMMQEQQVPAAQGQPWPTMQEQVEPAIEEQRTPVMQAQQVPDVQIPATTIQPALETGSPSQPVFVADDPKPEISWIEMDPVLFDSAESEGGVLEELQTVFDGWQNLQQQVSRQLPDQRSSVGRQISQCGPTLGGKTYYRPILGSDCELCGDLLGETKAEVYQHARKHLFHPPTPEKKCPQCRLKFVHARDLAAHKNCKRTSRRFPECDYIVADGDDWVGWALEADSASRREKLESELRTWEKAQLFRYLEGVYTLLRDEKESDTKSIKSLPDRLSKASSMFSAQSLISFQSCLTDMRTSQEAHDVDQLQQLFSGFALDPAHGSPSPRPTSSRGPRRHTTATPTKPPSRGGTQPRNYRVIILGASDSGKANIAKQFSEQRFSEEWEPHFLDHFTKHINVENCPVSLNIAPLIPIEENSFMINESIRTADGAILVFSITCSKSFTEAIRWRERVSQMRNEMSDNFPMVLVGNKSDLEDDREVEAHKATKLARHWNDMPYYETSAKVNLNLDEAFHDLGKQMLKREWDTEAENAGILPSLARKMPGRFPLRKKSNRSRKIPWAGSI
ncbi:hypothetical protein TI39_contig374g00008 [Zymoseptoria brevis]|uniref:C2H2-type domain-containing protein n=1 Tax=Zymoseptoria brevis TaxID=1047168 RepID=A0A0F4GNV4_9PEZI|nr:hypothetical protein TI39_contig374g00008 [Zymoseptoria brevis]